jgi:Protein of unknown function (DUF4241)
MSPGHKELRLGVVLASAGSAVLPSHDGLSCLARSSRQSIEGESPDDAERNHGETTDMLRLIQGTLASTLLLGCGYRAPSVSEPSAPSAAVVRFVGEEAGHPDVGAARLEVRQAGKISLPDGQLAVSDAFINDYPLIVAELLSGDYSVELLVAATRLDARVAAARIRVRNESVASWRRLGGIAIDSGTGAFFNPRISSTITPSNVDRFNDGLLNAASERPTYSIVATPWQGMTFVAFSTGFGDGRYPVYVGSSVAGLAVDTLVDCEILPWPQ